MKCVQWIATSLVWGILCCLASAQDGGLRFSLTDLEPALRGESRNSNIISSVAYAISDSGRVTGSFYINTGDQYCFVYTPGKSAAVTFTSSTTPHTCDARAINSTGYVAGSIG